MSLQELVRTELIVIFKPPSGRTGGTENLAHATGHLTEGCPLSFLREDALVTHATNHLRRVPPLPLEEKCPSPVAKSTSSSGIGSFSDSMLAIAGCCCC